MLGWQYSVNEKEWLNNIYLPVIIIKKKKKEEESMEAEKN